MPFLIRSRGRLLDIRDRGLPDQPLYKVGPDSWVPFVELPANMDPISDGDCEVHEVESLEGHEAPKAVPPRAPRAAAAAAVPTMTARQAKRRGGKATLAGTVGRKAVEADKEHPL